MKVNIGPYRSWVGPYQIAEKILFWMDKDCDTVYEFGKWLANTPLSTICQWFDRRKKRKVEIKIDAYDTWSMDFTLSLIIVPMLKQLKSTNHGHPSELIESEWDEIMDKMIWSFNEIATERKGEKEFESGEIDFCWEEQESGLSKLEYGPAHTFRIDMEGLNAYNERIQEGLNLFGKYYQNLWD